MVTAMSAYVHQTMTVMRNNDVLPTWVQISNEINSGICRPVGSVSSPAQMTGLLNAAYTQVKAVSPGTVVCVHLAQPQNYDVMTTFFSRYAANGGKWDMSVFSSYGSADYAPGIVANMRKISDAYGKPFLQSEFGGRVDRASTTRAALVAYIKALKANGGQGIFYWEPGACRRSPATTWARGTPPPSGPPSSWTASPRPERRARCVPTTANRRGRGPAPKAPGDGDGGRSPPEAVLVYADSNACAGQLFPSDLGRDGLGIRAEWRVGRGWGVGT